MIAKALAILMSAAAVAADGHSNCKAMNVDFIVLEGEATLKAIEGDIATDLAKIGVNVTTRLLAKDAFNAAMVAGDFNMAFSETWGAPYDPQAFATSWATPDEAYYAALKGLPAPMTQAVMGTKIKAAQTKTTEAERQAAWTEILTTIHDQATEIPISSKRIPAVINNRLTGYAPGFQQFDYPAHTLKVASGADEITVAPGAQSGLMGTGGVGRLDPHTYRPNEFFANNWVYEGLVGYGKDGLIVPALATSWAVADRAAPSTGETFTFTLRQGVKFHDGEDWKCSVAKLNFDHVFVAPLTTGDWHGWYGMVAQLDGWSCTDDYTFVLHTKEKFYPTLQELSFIRPMRFMSPKMFVGGAASSPVTQNSCHVGWGTATLGNLTITCAGMVGGGISAGGSVAGTGRWKYVSTTKSGSDVASIKFEQYTGHWDPPTGAYVKTMNLKYYATHTAVKAALLDNSLDAVLGAGVLTESEVADFQANHAATHTVSMTAGIQNRIVVLNTAKAPTNVLNNRKAIIQAVDKQAIITKEMAGLAEPATSLFPKSNPYCNLPTNWNYDLAAAQALNCPTTTTKSGAAGNAAGFLAFALAAVGMHMM